MWELGSSVCGAQRLIMSIFLDFSFIIFLDVRSLNQTLSSLSFAGDPLPLPSECWNYTGGWSFTLTMEVDSGDLHSVSFAVNAELPLAQLPWVRSMETHRKKSNSGLVCILHNAGSEGRIQTPKHTVKRWGVRQEGTMWVAKGRWVWPRDVSRSHRSGAGSTDLASENWVTMLRYGGLLSETCDLFQGRKEE